MTVIPKRALRSGSDVGSEATTDLDRSGNCNSCWATVMNGGTKTVGQLKNQEREDLFTRSRGGAENHGEGQSNFDGLERKFYEVLRVSAPPREKKQSRSFRCHSVFVGPFKSVARFPLPTKDLNGGEPLPH